MSDLSGSFGMLYVYAFALAVALLCAPGCDSVYKPREQNSAGVNDLNSEFIEISRSAHADQLEGFWLGQCIANWTGLVTEMDKIGNIGEIQTGPFYTREDWGKPDQPNIWSGNQPSDLSETIDFVLMPQDSVWGADDDTDIEYMYQYITAQSDSCLLSPFQIRDGWLKHIREEEENYLWVSNQRAFDLMREGTLPPKTGVVENNEHCEMIDAQLTTEVFGLFAPTRPDIALELAYLPIRTTACKEAIEIAEFYVVLHALASLPFEGPLQERLLWMADQARLYLDDDAYPAAMYDFVLTQFLNGATWEQTRDSLYVRYQVEEQDGYDMTSRNLYCNGCYAAGINFGASMISYFYGKGNFKHTIKIGSLTGWDSDNPTATWGGLLGFMLGKNHLERLFDQPLSNKFYIHRTRQNFPTPVDSFPHMAETGIQVTDSVIVQLLNGKIDLEKNIWRIPLQ